MFQMVFYQYAGDEFPVLNRQSHCTGLVKMAVRLAQRLQNSLGMDSLVPEVVK
ncbi:MAG: hypothetical protein HON68_08530 [Gammaproteobacteria bacterium]|jgi:hypothetical protein|nr:hypothetical protein [Gammaproteobacteria bacterium]MBT3490194.1 hypothetical protein [Gammaproteobacteria bacterium]MBT3718743.1 hypothetical protein [Gammaproteobacteria bacterium]MBT3845764.1 hypothetical protein [Gammaproteobacteria bacterium]MBT3892046.1 hypothetical protein [Gammaproteobacteria bacterium]